MVPKVFDKWNRPKKKYEKVDNERVVETAGYISAQQQVENLINAGRQLNDYRRENYDFGSEEEVDDSFSDPTRDPNFDLADASDQQERAVKNLEIAEAEAKEVEKTKKAEAKKKKEEDAKELEEFRKNKASENEA